jgi:biopolymer transport protein ExbB
MPAKCHSIGSLIVAQVGRKIAAVWLALLMSGAVLAQEPAAEAAVSPASENMLIKAWAALGTMYAVVFLVMSIVLVALVVRAILAVQKNNFVPEDLVQGVEANLAEGNTVGAAELVAADESFLGSVLNAGLSKLTKPELVTKAN